MNITLLQTKGWDDYELLDTGNGKRLERFGKYTLVRPDPQVLWSSKQTEDLWQKADATFSEETKKWTTHHVPEKWLMHYDTLSFYAQLSPFKHTGVFPEQHLNWNFIKQNIKKSQRKINVLNLFSYTGIASLAAAAAGANVTNIDASSKALSWAKENQEASKLTDKPIRYILDDAIKFTAREIRRGNTYDAIIMDPPVYGHGPKGETWDFVKSFPQLVQNCHQLLSNDPLFLLINTYAISASSLMLSHVVSDVMQSYTGIIESGELALQEKQTERLLSTGIFARWSKQA